MSRSNRITALIFFAVLALTLVFWLLHKPKAPPEPKITVELAPVVRQDVPVLLRTPGFVRSLSTVDVRPQVSGTLMELPVAEGQRVRTGDLLARIDDRSIVAALRQAEADSQETQAELKIAQVDLQRYANLVKQHATPQQTLDQQKAKVVQLQAGLASKQAAVAAAKVQLSYTRILSPSDGRVGIRNAYVGSLVSSGDAKGLFSVVQMDPISVEASLPQDDLAQLQRMLASPQAAKVTLYQEDGGQPLAEGRLSLIDNRISTDTGTIRVKASFDNKDEHLWPDQSVLVSLQADLLKDAHVIPVRAIRQGPDGPFVWKLDQGHVQPTKVAIRYQTAEQAVVDALQPGEQVVVDGQKRLRPGSAVQNVANLRRAASTQ